MKRTDFEYELPESAIAQEAVEPRDAARLLETSSMTDLEFTDLPSLLEPGDLLVVNTTRVRRARLRGTKVPTGGAVELLVLAPRGDGAWEALVRPARRVRTGTTIELHGATVTVIDGPTDGTVVIEVSEGDLQTAFDAGEIPLPPYFSGSLDDPDRYQTVYADRPGSAAAPTAGLHFTERVFDALADRGVDLATVELDIGLDTFRPISAADVGDHRMHTEVVRVSEATVAAVAATKARGGRVVAVGTTVVRSLEAAASTGTLEPMTGPTDLFITPGYGFRVVDAVVTNFHVPGSTLIVLVAAFMGERWRAAYTHALGAGYRFLSFGDAMWVERSG